MGAHSDECLPASGIAGGLQSIGVRIETWETTSNIQNPSPTDPERLSVRNERVSIDGDVSGEDVKLRFFGKQLCVAETVFEDRKSTGQKSRCSQYCLNPGDKIRITYSVIDSGSIMPRSMPPCCLSTRTMYHEIYVEDPSPSTTPAPAFTCIDDKGYAQQKEWSAKTCQEGDRCFLITSISTEGGAEFYMGGCESVLKYESTNRPTRAGHGASCSDGEDWESGCLYDAKIYYSSGQYDFVRYPKYCIKCCGGDSCNDPLSKPDDKNKPDSDSTGAVNVIVIITIVVCVGLVIVGGFVCFFCFHRSLKTPLLTSEAQQGATCEAGLSNGPCGTTSS